MDSKDTLSSVSAFSPALNNQKIHQDFKNLCYFKKVSLSWPDNNSKETWHYKDLHETSAVLPHWAELSSAWDQTWRVVELVADRQNAIKPCASLRASSDWLPVHTASPRAPWRAVSILKSVCSQSLGLSPSFPAASLCCSLEAGEAPGGPRELSEQWERAPSLALAKQGRRTFVCASAPLIANSSLKTRHKEAAEEPDKPPPVSSPSSHDSPRLSGSLRASRAALPWSPARGQSSSSQADFCLLNYSNNSLEGDQGWPWQHRLCAFLLL